MSSNTRNASIHYTGRSGLKTVCFYFFGFVVVGYGVFIFLAFTHQRAKFVDALARLSSTVRELVCCVPLSEQHTESPLTTTRAYSLR